MERSDTQGGARKAAVLFPGEMGSAVGRTLIQAGWSVFTYLEGRSARSRAAAEGAGIRELGSLVEILETVDLVISLVPPGAAESVAGAVATAGRDAANRPLYLDLNSVSPHTVNAVASVIAEAGLECVDGAFIGSAADLGGRTRLYLSGPASARLPGILPPTLRAAALGGEVGSASAFKLAFAGFNKGLVALFLEVMKAAEATGKPEELLACFREFYPGTIETLERLLPSYPKHAGRRAEEMDELAHWLISVQRDAAWAETARDTLARFSALELDGERRWSFADALSAWIEGAG